MADTYSISLEGMRNGGLRLERAATNRAEGQSATPPKRVGADVFQSSTQQVTPQNGPGPVDYAQESLTIIETKIGFETGLKEIAAQMHLDKTALDLLG
jgi:hypothetical protein